MSASRQHETWSELAVRENDGLVVSLFWSKATNRVQISVVDQMFDAELRIDVAGACALDAFYHPFAYAAGAGLGFGCANREPSTSNRPERSAAR
jgi:hypothetical protein